MAALTTDNAVYDSLKLGVDSTAEGSIALNILTAGYDKFASAEDVDISLIMQGKAMHGTNDAGLAKYIIDNICEKRKDCVLFASPSYADVVNNIGGEVTAILAYRNALTNSSYALIDSGYKYAYDKYNDVYLSLIHI